MPWTSGNRAGALLLAVAAVALSCSSDDAARGRAEGIRAREVAALRAEVHELRAAQAQLRREVAALQAHHGPPPAAAALPPEPEPAPVPAVPVPPVVAAPPRRPVTGASVTPPPAPGPRPEEVAIVRIGSEPPGASVSLNGRLLGQTPYVLETTGADGPAQLVLEADGYERAVTSVEPVPGRTQSLSVKLRRAR